MLASSHYQNVSKQTTRYHKLDSYRILLKFLTVESVATVFLLDVATDCVPNEIYTLILFGLDSICATFSLVIRGWSRLPPIQYQQSRSEMSIDNMCISVTNETSFLLKENPGMAGKVVH
ncbi:hypothetical protein Tco_1458287 [Tanacetum coccineum]